jgi:hypothetical protein
MAEFYWIGVKELQNAIKRNPHRVLDEARTYLTRGMSAYKRGIINNPWRVGGMGGGSPVSNDPRYKRKYQRQLSGNLRDSHIREVNSLEARIGPTALYAKYVHHGTRRMQGRPWLEYVKQNKNSEIERLYREMLKNIVGDLAK